MHPAFKKTIYYIFSITRLFNLRLWIYWSSYFAT